MTRIPGLALAVTAALLAAACSTASPGPTATTTGSAATVAGLGSVTAGTAPSVTAGTAPSVATGTPASGASRSMAPSPSGSPAVGDGAVAAGGAGCGPADVAITQGAAEGAAGSVFVPFTVRNTSSSPCVTSGYPVLELADDQGPLPTTLTREPGDAPSVTLAPGSSARFVVAFSKVPQGSEDCPAATRLAVTLPGASSATDVPVQDVAPCGGQLRVRPVQPA